MPARHIPLERRLRGADVCVCVGPGGVGKTTVSAAIGLGLALRGKKVVVLSIDPAKRLASALGLDGLPGEPHRIDLRALDGDAGALGSHTGASGSHTGPPGSGTGSPGRGAGPPRGELWAMMLDSKGTFDGLVRTLAPDEDARREVLSNRIYHELSSAVAGSQEFTAVAKLYELHRSGDWDAIVLDTPPSRSALDFLDSPERLTRFLDGRALKLLSAPGGLARRGLARGGLARGGLGPGGLARGVLGRGAGVMFSLLSRLTGVDLIGELSGFFRSLSGLTDGFRDRARGVELLLRDERTRFLIVTSPEPEPAREAVFLREQLERHGMRLGGVIVNLVHDVGLDGHSVQQVAALLAPELGDALAARVAANLGDFDLLARRDADVVGALSRALGEADPLLVRRLDGDPQDLASIGLVAKLLFA